MLHQKKIIVISAVIFLATIIGLGFFYSFRGKRDTLYYANYDPPSSADPMVFDFVLNQPFQSMVNVKLFSSYSGAHSKPQLVKSWRATNSNAEWIFKIREDVTFADGAKVEPVDVVRSLKRIAYLLRKKNSVNDFINSLEGIERLTSIEVDFPGISLDKDNNVVLKLKRPFPKLLETLSFGLFAVVKQSEYDSRTGEWVGAPRKGYPASGPYELVGMKDGGVTLELRKNYPSDLFHPKAFKKIEILPNDDVRTANLIVGSFGRPELESKFKAKSQGDYHTAYFFCHSWKLKSSPLSSTILRKALREEIREFMQKRGFYTTRSFFPLVLTGISEPKPTIFDSRQVPEGKNRSISFNDIRPSPKPASVVPLEALEAAAKKFNLKPVPLRGMPFPKLEENKDPDLKSYSADIGYYSTELSALDPEGDVRFMFSKEGIQLPDATGEIMAELKKDPLPVQKINELLYDQAIIWPLRHYAMAFWYNREIDFSLYNLLLTPGEFQWLGSETP